MGPEPDQGELGDISVLAGAFALVALSVGGYLVGRFVDGFLHSAPIGAIIGLLLGVAVGFYDLYRISVRVMRRQDRLRRERIAGNRPEDIAYGENEEGTRDNSHETE